CFSIIDWEFRWQRPQQIMAEFAAQGHRVFYLRTTDFLPPGDKAVETRQLRPNVWEVRLAPTGKLDVYSGELSAPTVDAVLAGLHALRKQFNITCAVSVVQTATWAEAALAARDRFGWRVVYDCMDEWTTFPGINPALLAQEERLVAAADLVVVTGQRLLDKWATVNPRIVLARNAADFAHFHQPPPNDLLADAPRPIVGYFGAIAEWFDLALVLRLARARPQYTFVLLGGVFNVPTGELRALPNVYVLGQKPYALMPAYLQHFDACLIPFKVNPITEATDPVKFYEYISQGKPVVATHMPELYPYRDLLYIADDYDDFIRQVDLAVRENDPALRERRVALAHQNTWKERVTVIKDGIGRAHPRVSLLVVSYNGLDHTRLCLESVRRNTLYPNYEMIVVDNGSSDGSAEFLTAWAAEQPNARVILNPHNAGFAVANNQALAAATGDILVLLNNDTITPNGWLPRLVRHLTDPAIGLVVSATNFSGNESRVEVDYTDLEGMEAFAAAYTQAHEGQVFDIRVAAMYCVALRREVYETVGPLDERFSVGLFEDDDYSHRVRLAGWRVVCAEDAFVHHFGQASFKKLSPAELRAIWDRNQRRYEDKWSMDWQPHQGRR
ncbi:MAG: glycosyltransferase, partial [Anaerolineae bacterium]|nr:glycosyltransferase [Anaerolineae bacterium]